MRKGEKMTEALKEKMLATRQANFEKRGYWITEKTRKKMSKAHKGFRHTPLAKYKIAQGKLGYKNPMWKGDKVGCGALHDWVKYHLPKIALCQICQKVPSQHLANIGHTYKRNLKDWLWLCAKCHIKLDKQRLAGAIKNLEKVRPTKRNALGQFISCG